MWLCGRDFLGAELLLPPLGLAALDLGLRLRDVRGQLSLLVREPLLELGERLFALFELVGADLQIGGELGLAQVDLALAVVELLVTVVQVLLEVAQARFLAVGALLVRLGDRLEVVGLGLAGGQLLLALLQPLGPLVEVATAVRVALGVGDRGLQPVQLGLLGGQVELPPVELCRALDGLARDPALVGQLALEPVGVSTQLLLLEQDVRLALADRLVAGGDARRLLLVVVLARRQLALSLRELLVTRAPLVLARRERTLAAVEPGRAGLLLRRDLALLLRQLPLTLVERGLRPLELAGRLLALPVARLQLPQPPLRGLLLLGREGLLGHELGLEVRDARVLGLDRLALVADPPLALLELDLELGQLRLALVESRRAVGELLLRADVLVVGFRSLLQLLAQRGLTRVG